MKDLPDGWIEATIPEIIAKDGVFVDGDWVESKDQDPSGDVRLIQLADIGDGVYRDRSSRFLTLDKARELNCTFLERGDILIARMPDPLGRACSFPGDSRASVTVVDVCVVRPAVDSVSAYWLVHALNSPQMRRAMVPYQKGTTRRRISRRNLGSIPLPIPPRAEQERIVDVIEEQFSRLEAGVAAQERIWLNLKRMRAAVMQSTMTGGLVSTQSTPSGAPALLREILEARLNASSGSRRRYKQPVEPLPSSVTLPPHWAWASLDMLSESVDAITDGPFGSNLKSAHYTQSGPRVIRLQNIGDGDFLDAEAHISEEHFRSLTKHEVKPGDLVCVILGETLPRSAIIPEDVGPAIVKADCPRVRLSPLVNRRFVWAVLNAPSTRREASARVHGVGRPRLNLKELRQIPIPLPPRAEQDALVDAMDRHLDAISRIEGELTKQRDLSGALRSSILAAAFSGKLADQSSSDESAAALLERIAANGAMSSNHTPVHVKPPKAGRPDLGDQERKKQRHRTANA